MPRRDDAGRPADRCQRTWHMRTPEGQSVRPGSLVAASEPGPAKAASPPIASSPKDLAGPWRGAAELFPSLTPLKPTPVAVAPPTTHVWLPPDAAGDETAPFAAAYAPFASGAASGRYTAPHRGGLILILGLLGFMINCPIFCLMAWVMGSSDLREMRAGRMDPSGERSRRSAAYLV